MQTFMKSIHVQLTDERRYVRMFEVLPARHQWGFARGSKAAYESTLAKSAVGDITKLSLLLDHEIIFCIAGSSSMLRICLSKGLVESR